SPTPEMATLEHEVRDGIVVVDEEPIHLAEPVAICRRDLARPPNLDPSFGDSAVGYGDTRAPPGRPGGRPPSYPGCPADSRPLLWGFGRRLRRHAGRTRRAGSRSRGLRRRRSKAPRARSRHQSPILAPGPVIRRAW